MRKDKRHERRDFMGLLLRGSAWWVTSLWGGGTTARADRSGRTEPPAPATGGNEALAAALATLQDARATVEQKAVAAAFFTTQPVSLMVAESSLGEAFAQLFAQAGKHIAVRVDPMLTMPVSVTLTEVGFAEALGMLLRIARRSGQAVVLSAEGTTVVIGPGTAGAAGAGAVLAPISEDWPVFIADSRLRFDRTISRGVLNNYLSRAVTHLGLCASSPEKPSSYFEDDLRKLAHIGARFLEAAAYAWTAPDDDEAFFALARERTARVHQVIPEAIVQGGIPETAYQGLERFPVPDWVFVEYGLPVEKRNFRYEAMLYDGGKFRDHWVPGGSIPDMSKRETQMYFYYRARRFIDSGFESLNFAQVALMDQNDVTHRHWLDLLTRIRRYAARNARRRMVLCTAHTHGIITEGSRLLFDFHGWPMRTREMPNAPGKGRLTAYVEDAIYGRSAGGMTPSGWTCDRLPYVVEIDNWGAWGGPDKSGAGRPPYPWVWGDDEIGWFAHQSEADRNAWLQYVWAWVTGRREDGWVELPTRRVLADAVNGVGMYHANTRSNGCPIGFSQEETIKAIWRSPVLGG